MPVYDFQKYARRRKNSMLQRVVGGVASLFGWRRRSTKIIVIGLIAVAAFLGWDLPGKDFTGRAYVIDGDTLEIEGQRIRLFGIDAPESDQTCTKDGHIYLCGKQATSALADKIDSKSVTCREKDIDKYQRVVAICSAEGADLNRWMVAEGHAVAYVAYSFRYLFDDLKARYAGRGIWSGEFQNPADYRHSR
jgi:endonuclease YncB( thermonuclease family)